MTATQVGDRMSASPFSHEAEAYKLLEDLRWPNGPVCTHCGMMNKAYYLAPRDGIRKTRHGIPTYRRIWKCARCRKQFSVLVGTAFEDSHFPLSKWLLAVHELCVVQDGVAIVELARKLHIAYRSAWFMAQRIRWAVGRTLTQDSGGNQSVKRLGAKRMSLHQLKFDELLLDLLSGKPQPEQEFTKKRDEPGRTKSLHMALSGL